MGCTLVPNNNDEEMNRRRVILSREIRKNSLIYRRGRPMILLGNIEGERDIHMDQTRRLSYIEPDHKNKTKRASIVSSSHLRRKSKKFTTRRRKAFDNIIILKEVKESLPKNLDKETLSQMVQNALKGQIVNDPSQVVEGKTVSMEQVDSIADIVWFKLLEYEGKNEIMEPPKEDKQEQNPNEHLLSLKSDDEDHGNEERVKYIEVKNSKENEKKFEIEDAELPSLIEEHSNSVKQESHKEGAKGENANRKNSLFKLNNGKEQLKGETKSIESNTNTNSKISNGENSNHKGIHKDYNENLPLIDKRNNSENKKLQKGRRHSMKIRRKSKAFKLLFNVRIIVGIKEISIDAFRNSFYQGKKILDEEFRKELMKFPQGNNTVKVLTIELQ